MIVKLGKETLLCRNEHTQNDLCNSMIAVIQCGGMRKIRNKYTLITCKESIFVNMIHNPNTIKHS